MPLVTNSIIISGISGFIGGVAKWLYDVTACFYRKRKANSIEQQRIDLDATELSIDASIKIIGELRAELNRQKGQIEILRKDNERLQNLVGDLLTKLSKYTVEG
jgi:small-conductance mechanosensitive channel